MTTVAELQETTRRAFVPRVVMQLYKASPALEYLLAGNIGMTLRAQGLYFRGRAVGRPRRLSAVRGFSSAVKYGIVLQ